MINNELENKNNYKIYQNRILPDKSKQ